MHFQTYGQGPPLIILHGLFGSLENWHSISLKLATDFQVYAVDQRNHGGSPHSSEMSYHLMAEDLNHFVTSHRLGTVYLLGHSMGGKTAMRFALNYPSLVAKLAIVDMAPRAYPPHHSEILNALLALNLASFNTRKDMETSLAASIPNLATRQFLLKNVKRDSRGAFYWQMNLTGIDRNYDRLSEEISNERPFEKPVLFIRGERSDYVRDEDLVSIRKLFPQAKLYQVAGAGHWLHADAPEAFLRKVREFFMY